MNKGLITKEADKFLTGIRMVQVDKLRSNCQSYATKDEEETVTEADIEENGNSKKLNKLLRENIVSLQFQGYMDKGNIEVEYIAKIKGEDGDSSLFERMNLPKKHGNDGELKRYPIDIIAKFMIKNKADCISMTKDEWKLLKKATEVKKSGNIYNAYAGSTCVFSGLIEVGVPYWSKYYE